MDCSATPAGLPVSRQKNCNSCVHAKRRCDRRTPICSRCAEKKISCIYGKTRVAFRVEKDIEPSPSTERPSMGSPACSLFGPGLSLDMDYSEIMAMDSRSEGLAEVPAESTQKSVIDAFSGDDIHMDAFINLMGTSNSPLPDQWLVPMDQRSMNDHPSALADEEVVMAYDKMASLCDYIDPWHLYDPTTPLYYIMQRVKGFTNDLATRNTAPFLHPYLYKSFTPQCILSCFTTSVLYSNRTQSNTAMVMRALHGSVRDLVDAEAGRVMANPTEKLARVQALFIYQVIRLFDGDVNLRSRAEKDIPLLQTWLSDLCRIRENLGTLTQLKDGIVRKQPPEEWERWIFAESVRRTVIMAYSVLGLYELMKGPANEDDLGPRAYSHPWTLSRHLWEADSSFKFDRMWNTKPHFIITNYSFENFLQYGTGDDVDEFAEILLSACIGVDAMKEFISAKETGK